MHVLSLILKVGMAVYDEKVTLCQRIRQDHMCYVQCNCWLPVCAFFSIEMQVFLVAALEKLDVNFVAGWPLPSTNLDLSYLTPPT